ncbi:MarR family winged helix-turn-helix transcriptional regulator [Egicoccus halophilus]|uniref:Putative transcriptional regulator, MarR family protein n=1 Tax=Egicoccus halophilus TaxID=1670830 RepID=A0A8J3A9U0_9ACTN|nr:MarR family transcriptional regulator [Egicoccus halophilus]GGI08068.1 putative transcriptional regulator, MarR family protein [Egicoccus halophilus]
MTEPLPFDPIAEAHRLWVEHGWDGAADGMAVVTSVVRSQQILLARIDEQLRDLELSLARYEVLMLLHFSRSGSLPLVVIGSRLQVHATSVTSAVQRLVKQGLVTRRRHPTDRRTTLAGLTDAGRERALEATRRLNATVFADPGLDPDQARTLVDVLRSMRRRAGDF